MTEEAHLTSEDVAAYLDNALSESDGARIRAHLAGCEACRAEIGSVSRLIDSAPRAGRRFVALPALAAAAVIIVFAGKAAIDSRSASDELRGNDIPATLEGVSAFQAVTPRGRQPIGDGVVFVWRPPLPGVTYRFTLTDEQGGKIWIGSTSDTSITLPDSVRLQQERSYHWFVDGLLPDGTAATTGITSFQLAR